MVRGFISIFILIFSFALQAKEAMSLNSEVAQEVQTSVPNVPKAHFLKSNLVNCKGGLAGQFKVNAGADPCQYRPNEDALIYIYLQRALYVCEKGKSLHASLVASGKGGFKKTRQGDQKTPLGAYALGKPRVSMAYGVFIPVAYPNALDIYFGHTGGDVGLHGPQRKYACDGTQSSWTNGCIATLNDNHIFNIARWVLAHPAAKIYFQER